MPQQPTAPHSNRLLLLYLPIHQPPTHPPTHPPLATAKAIVSLMSPHGVRPVLQVIFDGMGAYEWQVRKKKPTHPPTHPPTHLLTHPPIYLPPYPPIHLQELIQTAFSSSTHSAHRLQ